MAARYQTSTARFVRLFRESILRERGVEPLYRLEVKSLIDETVTTIDEGCLAHLPDVELGPFERDPAEIANDLRQCEDPPAGFEPAWCEARANFCEELESSTCASPFCSGARD